MITLKELLNKGEVFLKQRNVDDAEFDAFQLLLFATNMSNNDFYFNPYYEVSDSQHNLYRSCLERRIQHEPLQYILGKWDFFESEFYVGPGVLIPRPETEELVEICIKIIKEKGYKVVYDLCAGTGCIGISIAKACPDVTCYLFEYYEDAIAYTTRNAEASLYKNVNVIRCDVLSGCCNDNLPYADMIISNPPYIETQVIHDLQKEVLKEPVSALDGGMDGLMFYRAIADKWLLRLKNGGCAAVECGENQSNLIADILGFKLDCSIKFDMYGVDRFVIGFDNGGP